MYESETFRPIGIEVDYASGYTMPELYIQTSVARLYRVRKAGKYFIIKTASEDTGMAVAMLQREYELSIGLVHPGIVNVFTFEPATIVGAGIVMEYVDGRTLQEFLTEGPHKQCVPGSSNSCSMLWRICIAMVSYTMI